MLKQLAAPPPALDDPHLQASMRSLLAPLNSAGAALSSVVDTEWVNIDPSKVPSQDQLDAERKARTPTAGYILAQASYASMPLPPPPSGVESNAPLNWRCVSGRVRSERSQGPPALNGL